MAKAIVTIDKTTITIIGIGSSASFTNGAPIDAVLDTNIIMLMADAFLENGNILSS
jgi:hypothetical protein